MKFFRRFRFPRILLALFILSTIASTVIGISAIIQDPTAVILLPICILMCIWYTLSSYGLVRFAVWFYEYQRDRMQAEKTIKQANLKWAKDYLDEDE